MTSTPPSRAALPVAQDPVSPSSSPMLARRLQHRGILGHNNTLSDASINGNEDGRSSPATATATGAVGVASRVWDDNASPLLPTALSCYVPPPDAVPVELQVETMSSCSSRIFLYLWYAVLIAALAVESTVRLQWSSRNFCGAAVEVSAYDVKQWNSSACLSWEAYWVQTHHGSAATATRHHRWAGGGDGLESDVSASRYGLVAWPPRDAVRFAQSLGDACTTNKHAAPALVPTFPLSQLPHPRATTSDVLTPGAASPIPSGIFATQQSSESASASSSHPSPSPPPRPTMPPLRRVYKLRWTAEALNEVLDHELNRFLHVFISLASPLAAAAASSPQPGEMQRVYDVLVALEETSVVPDSSASSSSSSRSHSGAGQNESQYTYTYRASVTCKRNEPRCGTIVLPSSVVIPGNNSRLSVTLIDVDAELAEATVHGGVVGVRDAVGLTDDELLGAADSHALSSVTSKTATLTSGVGVMYQRSSYTIATLVVRYVFLLVTLISMLRFVYRGRHAQRLRYEQKWTLAAQVGLLLYLNPLYWWCIYTAASSRHDGRAAPALAPRLYRLALFYAEFHVPPYFVALIVCYIWSVIAGSFRWQSPDAAADADADADTAAALMEGRATEAGASSVTSSRVARSRARLLMTAFLMTVTVLDVAQCFLEEEGVGGTELTCKSATCLRISAGIDYLLLFGILSSGVGLYWLRRNLACHPYLSTRPQQLACRIMIFMYFTGGIYSVVQKVILDTLYAQLLGVLYYQPLSQISHVLVLNSLVNHMTYVYTTTQPSLQIPLRPNDPEWKRVGWSTRWYRWLDWHGGSLYVFFSEAEERFFYEVQVTYQLAKHKRKQAKKQAKLERTAAKKQNAKRNKRRPDDAAPGDEASARMARPDVSRTVLSRLEGRGGSGGGGCGLPEPGAETASADGALEADVAGSSSLRYRPAGAAWPSTTTTRWADTTESAALTPMEDDLYGPLRAGGRQRTLSTITTHASTSSSERLAMMDDSADDEEWQEEGTSAGKTDREEGDGNDKAEPAAGTGVVSTGLAETPAASAARRDDAGGCGDGISGCGPDVGEISALPQPLLPPYDGTPAGPEALAGFSFLVSQSNEPHSSRQVLSRVSNRMLDALHGAENRLVNGTATFLDFLAETCVDRPLRVLLRQRARQHFVFFNLETAMDCLNLSCEAYAVQESRGDEVIRTGIDVDATKVPRAALSFVERAAMTLFGLCFKPSPHHGLQQEANEEGEESDQGTLPHTGDVISEALSVPEDEEEGENEAAPLLRSSRHSTPPTTPPSPPQHESPSIATSSCTAAAADAAAPTASTPTQSTPQQAGSWRRFFASPNRAAAVGSGGPQGVETASATAGATSPVTPAEADRLPPMNVEQYGYQRIAVLETRGVQVVIARMDVSGACPVHVGKAPRLVIAFRGTDNVANAMEDMRFRQRTWKEMETPTLSNRAAVHSGFLELWMALKERVMDVVLTELRRQCVDAEEDGSDGNADSHATDEAVGDSAAEARGAAVSPTRSGHDVFHTAVPFSLLWRLPAPPHGSTDTQPGRSHRECGGGGGGGGGGFMRIYVTGHSLGGALASLCAYTLRRMLLLIHYPEPDLVVYTFGQPRIGNTVFKQYYNRAVPCTFRVVNESDAVSGFNIFGGHHVGVQVNVDRNGNYICKPMYIERLFRPTRGRGFAWANHTIAAYASSLNAIAEVYANGACPLRCRQPYVEHIDPVSRTETDDRDEGSDGHRDGDVATKDIDDRGPTASPPSSRSLAQQEEREAATEDGVAGDAPRT